jgi:predicted nucleic acid-binding protein
MTPAELFAQHQVVALDSNVLIYLLEGSGPLADAAEALLDSIEEGAAAGVLASVALTEILTRPASLGDELLFERYAEELRAIPNMRIVGLDAETAIDAAWGRSGQRDLGDAIHIATARRAGATCLVTNDSRVRGRAGVEVVSLADIVLVDSGQEDEATPLRRPQDAEVPSVERE